jgi:anti-anti-sigma factor
MAQAKGEASMSSPEFKHLRQSMAGDVAVVTIATKEFHGPYAASELGEELALVLAQDWAARVLVDFGRVGFLSSSGFAKVFKLVSQAKVAGRDVKLCNMDPVIRMGAEIVGLDKLVEIHDSESAGLRAFRPQAGESAASSGPS